VKRPTIVGYDPGTTAALAIIDTKGEILFLKSKRGYKKNEIINAITERGKPLIVAGDRFPLSKKVEKLASTLGCRTFHPEQSLSVVEKNELTHEFSEELKDKHEKDALASALRAFKFYSRLFRKAAEMLSSTGLSDYYDRVVEMLVMGRVDNMNDAMNRILTETNMAKKPEIVEKKTPEVISQKTVVKLQERIKSLEKDIAILKKYNEGLRDKVRMNEERIGYYRNRVEQKVDLASLEALRNNLERLKNDLNKKDALIQELKSFRSLELEGYIPVLEIEEVRSNLIKELHDDIDLEDRIILIKTTENAQIFNDYKIKALIIPRQPSDLMRKIDFPVLTEKDISIEKMKGILAVKKDVFEEKIKEARRSGILQWIKGHRERKL